MRGLLVRKEPLQKILSGAKTWEMRGSKTGVRDTFALIQSKSGTIVGTADLIDCVGPLTAEEMQKHKERHRVDNEVLGRGPLYPRTYAWVLTNVRVFQTPLPYKHPPGAVIWVNLDRLAGQINRRR